MAQVIQRKRQKSFLSSLSPVTKIFPVLIVLEVITGVCLRYDGNSMIWILSSITVLITVLIWFASAYYVSAKSRGAKNPTLWSIGALVGVLTTPIGIAILFFVHESKLGNDRRGFCPECGRRIAFDLSCCPFCSCPFSDEINHHLDFQEHIQDIR